MDETYIRWIVVSVVVLFLAAFAGMAHDDYLKASCARSYANSTRSAEEIEAICRGRPFKIDIEFKKDRPNG